MLLLSFSLRFLLFCTESSSLCVHFPQGNSKRQSIWRWARAKVIGVMSYKTDRERKWKEGKGRVAARSLTYLLNSFCFCQKWAIGLPTPSSDNTCWPATTRMPLDKTTLSISSNRETSNNVVQRLPVLRQFETVHMQWTLLWGSFGFFVLNKEEHFWKFKIREGGTPSIQMQSIEQQEVALWICWPKTNGKELH